MQIQIVGCGKMGEVILKGLLDFGVVPQDIYVHEIYQPQAEYICSTYSTKAGINPWADIIILAVKPQQIAEIDFSPFKKSALLFSIMAGVSINRLKQLSQRENIIRSMPNLPLSVNRGVIGYVESDNIDQEKKEFILNIFSKIGKTIKLKNEDQIDKITALSWSWPAYFYYLTEVIQNQAKAFGFSQEDATTIAQETFIGSAILMDHTDLSASQLKTKVSSPGGTTEAAIKTMKEKWIESIIQDWIQSAYQRAKQLGT